MAESAPYEVLARRYRSRDFDELVGQEAIARTLQNAISSNRTAHAYLFCGTRGVGKTSLARIFAKALNATAELSQRDAVGDAILQGRDTDVIEIDAASNRGIDNARDLIANAGIAPMRGPYRIYIIDEVHMLTSQAFNALLKTMEEPPRHVKFILCTTEPHQVPATIQSRCQRFDFRAIPASRIASHLREVVGREGLEAEPEALQRVARMANGSMRDALSLLDRLVSGASGRLTAAQLEELFGLPDEAVIDDLLAAIGEGRAADTLRHANELVDRGLSAERLLDSVAERLREVLVARVCGAEADLLDAAASRREALASLAARFDEAAAASMIALCDAVGRSLRSSSAPRALLDAALVRMCLAERFADAAALLAARPAPPPAGRSPKAPAPQGGANARLEPVRPEPVRPEPVRREASGSGAAIAAPPPAPSAAPAPPAVDRGDREATPAPRATPSAAIVEPMPAMGLSQVWSKVRAAAASPRLAAMLDTVEPLSFDGEVLLLEAAGSAAAAAWIVERPEPLRQLLEGVLGGAAKRIAIRLASPRRDESASPSPPATGLESHPVVRRAIDLFDAKVVAAGPALPWGRETVPASEDDSAKED
jgi:DNA polymerase-3 subunit gamma/tau